MIICKPLLNGIINMEVVTKHTQLYKLLCTTPKFKYHNIQYIYWWDSLTGKTTSLL